MADDVIGYSLARHPAPHRDRVSVIALAFGLFASPIAWAGNLMVTYALAAHACYPGQNPHGTATAEFGFAWPLMLACYLVTLALCAAAGYVSFRTWAATGRESAGDVFDVFNKGHGRTRYLGAIGICFAALFFAATLVGVIIFAIEPLCEHQL